MPATALIAGFMELAVQVTLDHVANSQIAKGVSICH
jgi:hypothetical protein